MSKSGIVCQNEYFEVQKLAEGVFGVFSTKEGGAMSNSGIVDLGDKVIVFDTFLSVEAAEELKKAAHELTGKAVSYAVNSHGHVDHAMGNNAFPRETSIVASSGTCRFAKAGFAEILDWHRENGHKEVNALKAQYETETDEMNRRMLGNQIKVTQMLSGENYEIRLPDVTFDGELMLYGISRDAKLMDIGSGHTPSDIILLLPQEKIMFTGDLLFVNLHPWLGSGNPHQLLKTIDRMLELDIDLYIPGHGPLGGKADLRLTAGYVKEIEEIAARINSGELKLEDAAEEMLPEPYSKWDGNRFKRNLKFYCEFIKNR